MNPAHIFFGILLLALIPFLAGAFILAMLAILDDEILPRIEEDEED
jgi:hypothetical protein